MAVTTDKDIPEDATGMLTPPKDGHQPFDGKAKSLTIGKPVNEGQLIEEVYTRLGDRDAFEVAIAGAEPDQTLYVLGDVDMRTVRGVVESHVPDPEHGLDESEKEIRQLKERLASGEDLEGAELNKLLRSLL